MRIGNGYFRNGSIIEGEDIGVVAIGTLGTWALPDKERNLSIRNQIVDIEVLRSIQRN